MSPAADHAPDYHRGFLRVPLFVWQALYCRAPLTRRQLQLVSVVMRESWGWQKKGGTVHLWTRPLPIRQLSQATGLSTDHLRRDLQILVDRNILRERESCYQLVPDPQLWITPPPQPPKGRSGALNLPPPSAISALSVPDSKTAKKKQRNVPPFSEAELSPAGDNSPAAAPLGIEPVVFPDRSVLEDQFLAVVAAFADELSAEQKEYLGARVQRAGIAAVWAALAEPFRRGPTAVRRALEAQLRERPERDR